MMLNIVALFDMSGLSVKDWAENGFQCFCLDILNNGRVENFASGGSITFMKWNALSIHAIDEVKALSPALLLCFPPCTDLAVSGARHFEAKALANPDFQYDAMKLVMFGPMIAQQLGIHFVLENPVGVIGKFWRKQDYIYDPAEYGGYLPPDDKHPKWPSYIVARDAYPKKTCIWQSRGLRKPKPQQVPFILAENGFSLQHAKLGGKSQKTKEIRALTPRGWARAFFLENRHLFEN